MGPVVGENSLLAGVVLGVVLGLPALEALW